MTITNTPYVASTNGADEYAKEVYSCGDYCVSGPGDGLGYYSYAQYPNRHFETWAMAELVADMMNEAFKAGLREQQRRTKDVLGVYDMTTLTATPRLTIRVTLRPGWWILPAAVTGPALWVVLFWWMFQ